jgi:tetratricopeptide (TPR) repeat protein
MILNVSDSPAPASGTFRPPWKNPWFYSLLSCFLLLVLLSARLIGEPDLGFHLRGGQWMVQNHRFFSTDVYTYTLSGHPYLDIHWLYQILLYITYWMGGYPFLTVLNMVFLLAVFILIFQRLLLTGAPLGVCVLLLAAVLVASETRFKVRPENLSWLLMSLTLWVLDLRARQKRDLLFLLPPIHLAWANIEGLFGVGWALMGTYLLGGFFHSRRLDSKLLKASALSVAACFINPNFERGAFYPLSHLFMLGTSNAFHQNIGELSPTWSLAVNDDRLFLPEIPLLAYKAFSFFLLFLLLATFRKRKLHEILLALSFFYLSTTAYRNIPLFMLVAVPIAAACWQDIQWEWLQKFQRTFLEKPAPAWAFTLCALLFCMRVSTNAYYLSDRRPERFGLGLNPEKQPVEATQFLADNRLNGRILNQDMLGGWLDWKGPQQVFVDGRLEVTGEDFYDEYLTAYHGGLGWLAQKYGADIIFFGPSYCNWAVELGKAPDWRLVYLDNFIAIYLRKSYAPQVPTLGADHLRTQWGIPPTLTADASSLLQAPSPSRLGNWVEGLYRPQAYPKGLYDTALYFVQSGNPSPAESFLLQAIRQSGGSYWEFYFRLAKIYFAEKQYAKARLCLEKVLEAVPHNKTARLNLANLDNLPAGSGL